MDNRQRADLMSDKALVAARRIVGENGGSFVYCVVLADGYILECGDDTVKGRERAAMLAGLINKNNPSNFRFIASGGRE